MYGFTTRGGGGALPSIQPLTHGYCAPVLLVAVLLVAMAAVWATGGGRRAGLAVGAGAVAAFAAAPILGALVGGAVEGLQGLAGHAGHRFADEQGAWAILPAFQVGLFAALWIAFAGRRRAWRRALAGLQWGAAWPRPWAR